MTMVSALDRVSQIQATIGALESPAARTATATTTPAPATTVADLTAAPTTAVTFQQLLSTATATSAAAAAPSASTPVLDDGQTAGDDIVTAARDYLGIPYVWGGESMAEGGYDCSGLVQSVFKEFGIEMPRVARDQMREGQEVGSLADARPGDLIVTRGGAHIMIYIGDNKVLHAPRPGKNVEIREMFETDADITTIRRIVPSASPAEPGAAAPPPGIDLLTAAQSAALTGAR